MDFPTFMQGVSEVTGLFTPVLSIVMAIGAAHLLLHMIIKCTKAAIQPPDGEVEDKRKKKKDEYDAYYDERLAEAEPHPLNGDIAYYEEVQSTNVVSG